MTVVSRGPAPDLNLGRIFRQLRRPCQAERPVYRGAEAACYNRAQHWHEGRWYCWIHLQILQKLELAPPSCPTCGQETP